MEPPVAMVALNDNPNNPNKKFVTKRYPDGRTLSIVVVDDDIVEKHMTYKIKWNLDAMEKEQEKGATGVSFKYWEKRGLAVVKSYYGTYLVSLLITLDYTLVTHPNIKSETLQDELDYDTDFPMVDVTKLAMEDGYSSKQRDHDKLASIMHGRIDDALAKFKKIKATNGGVFLPEKKRKAEEAVHRCESCGELPCVWTTERDTVVAKDEMEHGHTNAIANSARRKVAYRHMFYVVNDGYGQKGVRKRLPVCVEIGIRALFPDVEHMGFKEE
jgi:hypothetical protein